MIDMENFLLSLFDGYRVFEIENTVLFHREIGVVQFKDRQYFDIFLNYTKGFMPSDMEDNHNAVPLDTLNQKIIDIGHSDMIVHYDPL